MKLRSYLILLVVAAVLPVVVFAGVMAYVSYQRQWEDLSRGMIERARAVSAALDRELLISIQSLKVLAASEHLDRGQLSESYKEMKRGLAAYGHAWQNITLLDPSGRQVINLRLPFGAPLPRVGDPEFFERIVQSWEPVISDLFPGPVTGTPSVVVGVPVLRHGRVRYVMVAGLSLTRLLELLSQQKLPPGWIATIIDRNQIIIARTRDFEKYLGKRAAPFFADKSREVKEATVHGDTLEGVPVSRAFNRSDLTGWTVGIAIPRAALNAPVQRSLMITAGGGFALLLLGVVLATSFGRRIATSIASLSNTAEALIGEDPAAAAAAAAASGGGQQIAEVSQVARAIQEATVRRTRAAEALRHSQEQLTKIVATAPGVVCSYRLRPDGSTCFPYASPRIEEFYGVKPELLAEDNSVIFTLIHPDDVGHMRETIAESARTMNPWRDEFRVRSPAKGEIWLEGYSMPQREADGSILWHGIISDITAHKRAEEALRARYEDLKTLHEIGQVVLNCLDMKSIVESILDKALSIGPFDIGHIRLLDPKSKFLQVVASRGYRNPGDIKSHSIEPKDPTAGVIQTAAFNSPEAYTVENVPATPGLRTIKREGAHSSILIPILAQNQVLGTILLASRTPRKFLPQEVRLLETLGNQLGIAIQKILLHEKTHQHLERISALNEMGLTIASSLDLQSILDILLEQIDLFLSQSRAITVKLFNKESGQIEPVACRNLDAKEWMAYQGKEGYYTSDIVFETKTPVIIPDLQTDPRIGGHEFFRKHGLVSYLGMPLIAKDSILGVLGFYTKAEHQPSDEEIQSLSGLAAYAAIAIHNSQLYERSKRMSEELLVYRDQLRSLLTQMIKAREDEARRIARDLHDESGQLLAAVYIALDDIRRGSPPHIVQKLDEVAPLLDQIENQLRDLSHELHPTMLDDLGLLAALESLAQRFSKRTGIPVSLEEVPKQRFSSTIETVLYRAVQEALTNIMKHAQATAVHVRIQREDGFVRCFVRDNGIGFEASQPFARTAGGGLGLIGMRERVEMLNGNFKVQSSPGQGTELCVTLPLEESS